MRVQIENPDTPSGETKLWKRLYRKDDNSLERTVKRELMKVKAM